MAEKSHRVPRGRTPVAGVSMPMAVGAPATPPPPGIHRIGEHPRHETEPKLRKSDRTRARILEAGARLVERHGTAGFQMREVAEEADLAKSSLYYYYRDRDELVDAVLDSQVESLMDAVGDAVEDALGPREALWALCATLAASVVRGGVVVAALASDLARGQTIPGDTRTAFRELVAMVDGIQRDARARDLGWHEVDPTLLTSSIVGTYLMVSIAQLDRTHGREAVLPESESKGEARDPEALAAELMGMLGPVLGL